eukprot:4787508-Alexandrium_andersonii.AAC.1
MRRHRRTDMHTRTQSYADARAERTLGNSVTVTETITLARVHTVACEHNAHAHTHTHRVTRALTHARRHARARTRAQA